MIWKSTFIWDHLQRHGMKLSRCTQRLLKALQPQYKTESDLSSFIISLGDQGATFVTHVCHPRLSPLCVTARLQPGGEDRAIPPVPVSPSRCSTSQGSGKAGRAELGGLSVTAQEPLLHP